MISRNANGGFFAAHWDWIVLGLGLIAAIGALALLLVGGGTDPEEAAQEALSELASGKKSATGVKPVEMEGYKLALALANKPQTVAEVAETDRSFLASARRVFCPACHKPIPGDVKTCPLCGGAQEEPEKVTLDADGDGIPDEWEKKYGLDPANASDADEDKDGDGFTNAEEFAAGTDPTDPKSHPDYLDSLSIQLPVEQTLLPFYFNKATRVPSGYRFEFVDPKKTNEYGRKGLSYSVLQGQPIKTEIRNVKSSKVEDTGWVAKSYEPKTVTVTVKGGMPTKKDASVVHIERKSDGRALDLEIGRKVIPVDIKVKLLFNRGEGKTFTVIPGDTIELFNEKYKITEIKSVGKGAKVTLESKELGKTRTLEALEQ